MRVVRTRRVSRIVDGDFVISELPTQPRATGTLFDVLAASSVVFAPGPKMALLGFAAGGMVAPLRALGHEGTIEAVDLSTEWSALFREASGDWGGPVRLDCAEASAWLRRRRGRYDVIVDDLSEETPAGITKPWVSIGALPGLMSRRLKPRGVAVINLLPWPGVSWKALVAGVIGPYPHVLQVTFDDYENRLLIAGRCLPSARRASSELRRALEGIRSTQASRIAVRTVRRRTR